MKVNKTLSAKVRSNEVTKAAGPRRPLRKPMGNKPTQPAPRTKPTGNKPAQPSPPPKKPAGK